MSKGDRVTVLYNTTTGPLKEVIQAMRDGARVDVQERKGYLIVEEQNKAGDTIRQATFALPSVISWVEDHEKIERARSRKKP